MMEKRMAETRKKKQKKVATSGFSRTRLYVARGVQWEVAFGASEEA